MSSFYSFLKSTHHTNKHLEPTRTQQSNYVIAKLNVEKSLRLFESAYYKVFYANFTQKFSQTVIKCTFLRYSFFLKKKITHRRIIVLRRAYSLLGNQSLITCYDFIFESSCTESIVYLEYRPTFGGHHAN